jgi:hypothetical protein
MFLLFSRTGEIKNASGIAILKKISKNDSLIVSYLGYDKRNIANVFWKKILFYSFEENNIFKVVELIKKQYKSNQSEIICTV